MANKITIDAPTARDLLALLQFHEEMTEKDIKWALSIIRQIPGYEKVSIARAATDKSLRVMLVAIASEEIAPTRPEDLQNLLEEAKKREAAKKAAETVGEKRGKDFTKGATPKEAPKPAQAAKEEVTPQKAEEVKVEIKAPPPVEVVEKPTPLAAEPETPSIGVRINPSLFQSVSGLAKKTVLAPITLPVNYFLKAGSSAVYSSSGGSEKDQSSLSPFLLRAYGVDSRNLTSAISSAQGSGKISEDTGKKLLEVAKAIRKTETGSPWYIRTVFWAYGGNQVSLMTDLDKISGGAPLKNFLMAPTDQGFGFLVKDVAGEIGQRAIGGVVKKGAVNLLGKLGISVGGKAASLAAGPAAPVVAALLFFKDLVSWIKRLIQKNKGLFFGLFGAGLLGLGWLTGSTPLMLFGGAGVGLGAASALGTSPGSVLAGAANGISGAIVGLASLTVASLSASAVVALVALPVVIAIILFIINSGAYLVPPSVSVAVAVESPYIGLTKEITKVLAGNRELSFEGGVENSSLPLTVSYRVTVQAKKGTLANVSFNNVCQVVRKGAVPECDVPTPNNAPSIISPVNPFIFEYQKEYGGGFEDSFVTDVFSVKADSPDQAGATAATSAVIKIGAPPEECPSPWPLDSGYITQGAYSGPGNSHRTMEAIDIGAFLSSVKAGHSGQVVKAETSSCLGNYIEISSSCKGKNFVSQYAHLEGLKVRAGQQVTVGQVIGLSGNTGSCTTGPHLHYRFKYLPVGDPKYPDLAPYLMPPYIPKEIPRGCGETGTCNVSF